MSLSVIIVNRNTRELLRHCLVSLFAAIDQTRQKTKIEVIVVDNASSDGSIEMVRSEFPSIHIITNTSNAGYGCAINQAVGISTGTHLLFLNSDVKINENFVQNLFFSSARLRNMGIVGFTIRNTDHSFQPSCGNFPTLSNLLLETFFLDRISRKAIKHPYRILNSAFYQSSHLVDWVSGACMVVRRDVFIKIRGFDERYFLYVEDVDLCYRVRGLGYNILYLPIESVIHLNRGSAPDKTPAVVLTHHHLIAFFRKHYSPRRATLLRGFFVLKSLSYFLFGFLAGIVVKKFWKRTKSYQLLLRSFLSTKTFVQYERSLQHST